MVLPKDVGPGRPRVRVQVCGRIAVEVDGEPREARLPGRQGRLLLGFLVLHRHADTSRARLVDALWPADPPDAADTAVYALVSKLRSALGRDLLSSRGPVRLRLPEDTWVDLEAARDGLHRAESAQAQRQWGRAWSAAQTSLFVARRGFFDDEVLDWVVPVRRELEEMYVRALETYASAALHLGGAELATAERSARELVAAAPFRESGHRILMRALAARGNIAEALVAYEVLRRLLGDELGVAPSAPSRELHERLLRADRP